ncbi:MAG: PIG-L family deacetylase [Actinomycetota bacterium]
MKTLLCFHAHPDDESIATGGTIARAVREGHRVVLVMATDGRHGETPADLDASEALHDRRRGETERSAQVLGVHRLVWLGYHDSGMTGWPQNESPDAFMRADVDEAARRLADVIVAEKADVVTCYDWHGGYGHPDHIQVHRVGHRAVEMAWSEGSTVRVLESTMNRTRIVQMMREAMATEEDGAPEFDPEGPADDGNPFGSTEDEITMAVDVSAYVDLKRASIACHASQVGDSSMFLNMPPEMFATAFGTEWFIEPGRPGGASPGWFL